MVFKFLESASFKQLTIAVSSRSGALSTFQVGPLQKMTNLAGKLCPGQMVASKTQSSNHGNHALKLPSINYIISSRKLCSA